MSNTSEKEACQKRCWYIGGAIGLLLAFILLAFSGWGFIASVFTGIVVAVIAGWLLQQFLCANIKAAPLTTTPAKPASATTANTAAAAGMGAVAVPPVEPTSAALEIAATGSTASGLKNDPGAADAPAQKAASKKAPAKKPAAKKAPAKKTAAKSSGAATTSSEPVVEPEPKKPAAKKAAAPKAASAKAPAAKAPVAKTAAAPAKAPAKPKAAAKPARAAVAPDGKPEMLTKARAGGADDLKLISGVGPKLEGTLNELGVYHFDQVASWRKKEIEWVDERLRFKGRIERDGWIAQAKILAKGGETEFSKRKTKT